MLYIDVEVNGHKVKAFVDSGAQTTIMSPSCAEECGIMRLVDKRFAGIARGVGTAAVIGKVHSAQIKIGSSFLACSFTVMEGKDVDMLLGLDMLKSYQACIDLRKNRLIIQGDEIPFLGEADLPKRYEEAMEEPTVEEPGGTRVGAQSGTVTQPGNSGPATAGLPSRPATTSSQPAISSPPPSQPSQPQTATQGQNPYPAEAIEQLQQLGFSRDEAVAALNATGGNVDYAAGLLFQER